MSLRAVLPALTVTALMVVPAFSSPIVLAINGDAEVGATNINFGDYPVGAPYVPAPGFGVFETTTPIGGIFASNGVVAGEMGSIQSLNSTMEPAGAPLASPVEFMTFNPPPGGGANLVLYLTQLSTGNTGLSTSPIILADTPNGAEATVDFSGYILNTFDSSKTPYAGLFQATFSGLTVAQLLAAVPVDTNFSGTVSLTTVPEPASLLLAGAGLLGAGLIARRRKSRA
jgi:hypothetical protein